MMLTKQAVTDLQKGLECHDVGFSWDTESPEHTAVLKNISFGLRDGEFVSVIGPSGCGKSTLLNILCGLLVATKGSILIEGSEISGPRKEVGIVFQDYGLFPWLTVGQNVEFGMKLNAISKLERTTRAQDVLSKVGLLSAKRKYPHQLSGGMRQRAAIARVLANDSEYLLMDEPFGALDYQTRLLMQRFLLDVWKQFKKTILFVTHHVDEAVVLSERVFLMTARPGTFVEELKIDLPYPRDTTSKEFIDYRIRIITHLEREVRNGFEEQFA